MYAANDKQLLLNANGAFFLYATATFLFMKRNYNKFCDIAACPAVLRQNKRRSYRIN